MNYGQSIDGYGIKIGWSSTNHSWEYDPSFNIKLDWENNSGITARAFADISFLSFLDVEGEIGYSQKGAKYKLAFTTVDNPDGSGEFKTIKNRLDYLSVSLLGKIKYDLGLITPYIILGPEYNYFVGYQVELGYDIVYDRFKKNNLGFSFGVGSEIKILPVNIIVEYRYSQDLINNYDSSKLDIKNYSHSFMIGVKL